MRFDILTHMNAAAPSTTRTNFQKTVHGVVASIPKGMVATYGQIAELAGRPGAARAVGTVMSHNQNTKTTPCHRVVGSTGALAGYAYGDGLATKKKMLMKEGVEFRGEKVNLKTSQWRPKVAR
jgi:O-6-methylguanine DNA methyltransferase